MLAGALLTGAAAAPGAPVTVHLPVPARVAAQAASRAAGDATAAAPILMLEDLELGAGEGIEILVRAAPEPPTAATGHAEGEERQERAERPDRHPPVLGAAGTVGKRQATHLAEPVERVTLAIALNDQASRLLAGKRSVTLTLEVEGNPGRPPLRFKRAYFEPGESGSGGVPPPRRPLN